MPKEPRQGTGLAGPVGPESTGVGSVTPSSEAKHVWWRPDLQGMRTLGLFAIIAFHAGLPIRGGFTAIDMFFVLSGFVITGVLVRELWNTGRVSLAAFYLRRIRRLIPASALMVTLVLIFVAVLSEVPLERQATGGAGSAVSVFLYNIYYILFLGGVLLPEAGGNPFLQSWFLHMWSLSVEEQFYLVLPLLMVIAWRASRSNKYRATVIVLGIAWMLSFGILVVHSRTWIPDGITGFESFFAGNPELSGEIAYRWPFTRAWQFLTGALALLLTLVWKPKQRTAIVLGWLGLAIVIGGYALVGDRLVNMHIGYLVPVVGTVAVLLSGSNPAVPQRFLASRPLSTPILVAVGDFSYGWFLWHWPVIVLAMRFTSESWLLLLAGLAAVLPTLASYHWLENPIRYGAWFPSTRSTLMMASVAVAVPFFLGLSLALG